MQLSQAKERKLGQQIKAALKADWVERTSRLDTR